MTLSLTWEAFPDEGVVNYNSKARSAIATMISNGEDIEDALNFYDTTVAALVEASDGCKVSADDLTLGFLYGKLVAGDNINMSIIDPGLDESVEISADLSGYSPITHNHNDDFIALAIVLGG